MRYSFQQVIPGLYIGPQYALLQPYPLIANKITHLLSVNNYRDPPIGFVYKAIDIFDDEDQDIRQFFDQCLSFIKNAKKVLVFCVAGRSRSATIVAAYLMKQKQMTLQEALITINRARPVQPNPGFIRQLIQWEKQLFCQLCGLRRLTYWYEQTEKFAVIQCEQCDQPMVVLKQHKMDVSETVKQEMRQALTRAAKSYFGDQN